MPRPEVPQEERAPVLDKLVNTKKHLDKLKDRTEDTEKLHEALKKLNDPNLKREDFATIVKAADTLYANYRPAYLQRWDEYYPKMSEAVKQAIDTLTAMGSAAMKSLAGFFAPESLTGKILLGLSNTVAAQYAYLNKACNELLDMTRDESKKTIEMIRKQMADKSVRALEMKKGVKVTFEQWADYIAGRLAQANLTPPFKFENVKKVLGDAMNDVKGWLNGPEAQATSPTPSQAAPNAQNPQPNQPPAVPAAPTRTPPSIW